MSSCFKKKGKVGEKVNIMGSFNLCVNATHYECNST